MSAHRRYNWGVLGPFGLRKGLSLFYLINPINVLIFLRVGLIALSDFASDVAERGASDQTAQIKSHRFH